MRVLPWILLALVLAVPLFAQGSGPFRLIHASLVKSVPIDVRVPGQPAASDIVRIVQGAPYTVPPGKALVVTGFGQRNGGIGTWAFVLTLDGVTVLEEQRPTTNVGRFSIPFPHPGVSLPADGVVEVLSNDPSGNGGVAFGYIEDVQ